MLLLLIVTDRVAVVPTENNEVEDTVTGDRLKAVKFAVVSAAVEDFCPLVPLFMKPTLETPPEPLAVSDELSIRPSAMR